MDITSEIGTPAVLEQTAEECVELAEAITSLLRLAPRLPERGPAAAGRKPHARHRGGMPGRHPGGNGGCVGLPGPGSTRRATPSTWGLSGPKSSGVESRINARNAGEAANSPLDDVLGHEVTSYPSSVKIASEGDLIRRGGGDERNPAGVRPVTHPLEVVQPGGEGRRWRR